jgi:hypothetical protein
MYCDQRNDELISFISVYRWRMVAVRVVHPQTRRSILAPSRSALLQFIHYQERERQYQNRVGVMLLPVHVHPMIRSGELGRGTGHAIPMKVYLVSDNVLFIRFGVLLICRNRKTPVFPAFIRGSL